MKTLFSVILFLVSYCLFAQNNSFKQDVEMAKEYYDAQIYKEAYKLLSKYEVNDEIEQDSSALGILGSMYLTGRGTNKDADKGLPMIFKSANKNYAPAQFNMGLIYGDGDVANVKKDLPRAIKWYEKSLENGYTRAAEKLGEMYLLGKNVPKDEKKGLQLLEKANTEEGNLILIKYHMFQNTHSDPQKAQRLVKPLVEKGNKKAKFYYAVMLQQGTGVTKNPSKAFELYKELANGGMASAMLMLGVCYETGDGVAYSYEESLEWYEKTRATDPNISVQEEIARVKSKMREATSSSDAQSKTSPSSSNSGFNDDEYQEKVIATMAAKGYSYIKLNGIAEGGGTYESTSSLSNGNSCTVLLYFEGKSKRPYILPSLKVQVARFGNEVVAEYQSDAADIIFDEDNNVTIITFKFTVKDYNCHILATPSESGRLMIFEKY